jgi:hypothetical protein
VLLDGADIVIDRMTTQNQSAFIGVHPRRKAKGRLEGAGLWNFGVKRYFLGAMASFTAFAR